MDNRSSKKRKYGTPVAISFDKIPTAQGQCENGSGYQGLCSSGFAAGDLCDTGSFPGVSPTVPPT